MVISSLVVTTLADSTEDVAAALVRIPGVEVHEIKGFDLVVTIESETVDTSADTANSFMDIPGVLAVNLVYVNFEDDPSLYGEGVRHERGNG